eukprot:8513935-Pyramimonas_sp.AAC.1
MFGVTHAQIHPQPDSLTLRPTRTQATHSDHTYSYPLTFGLVHTQIYSRTNHSHSDPVILSHVIPSLIRTLRTQVDAAGIALGYPRGSSQG